MALWLRGDILLPVTDPNKTPSPLDHNELNREGAAMTETMYAAYFFELGAIELNNSDPNPYKDSLTAEEWEEVNKAVEAFYNREG